MMDEFDYIIIGAGSAGSVLANRLTAADATVCLLEAGPRDRNPFIHIPAGFIKTLTNPRVNWLFQTEPGEGTAGRPIATPRGKTLGGSSSINGHIYNRGQRLDFDTWAQMGNRGWSFADVLPYFQRSERRIGDGDDAYRGRDGELVVTDTDRPDPICDAFIEGVASLGIPRSADYNGAVQEGVGYFQRTIHKGRRMSAARAFPRSGTGPSQSRHPHRSQCFPYSVRRKTGERCSLHQKRRGAGCQRETRSSPLRRRDCLSPNPSGFRNRQSRFAAGHQCPGDPCACRRLAKISRITTVYGSQPGYGMPGPSMSVHAGWHLPAKSQNTCSCAKASWPNPPVSRWRCANRAPASTNRTCRLSLPRQATRKTPPISSMIFRA